MGRWKKKQASLYITPLFTRLESLRSGVHVVRRAGDCNNTSQITGVDLRDARCAVLRLEHPMGETRVVGLSR